MAAKLLGIVTSLQACNNPSFTRKLALLLLIGFRTIIISYSVDVLS